MEGGYGELPRDAVAPRRSSRSHRLLNSGSRAARLVTPC